MFKINIHINKVENVKKSNFFFRIIKNSNQMKEKGILNQNEHYYDF